MYNRTSATLMLQTIMVLMDKQNSTDVTNFPGSFSEDVELERCYGVYGCFSRAYPWTEHRPDNYFPITPEAMAIKYAAFTRRNRKIPVLLHADSTEKIQNANFDPKGPFYFISHGFLEGGHKAWIQKMSDSLLNLEGNEAASVFIVDWRGGSQPPYGQAVANIRLIGVMTAHLINKIYTVLRLSDLDNFHFIGHSLGAHLGGYCGHALQKRFNLKLGRITGLDPAAPYFSQTVTLVRLDRTDAKYVDIIHSNAMPLYFSGFGISEAIGHVDFFPNGGSTQPGCKGDARGQSADMYQQVVKYLGCNHERSYDYFIETIAPSCPFMAMQCDSYESFLAGNCTSCDHKHLCIPMGYYSHSIYRRYQTAGAVDTNSNIALYSITGESKPYCRVHYEVVLKVSNTTESNTHGPESGKLSITLVDRNNNKSDHKFLDDENIQEGCEKIPAGLATCELIPLLLQASIGGGNRLPSGGPHACLPPMWKFYKPGDLETKMVAVKDTGYPPMFVIVEWKYEANLFNPMTWRLLKSPSIYVEYMKLSSIEYNTDITVCPKNNKPVVANLPTVMKTKYCRFKK